MEKNPIYDEMKAFCYDETKTNGILHVDANTGDGKSHNAIACSYDYINDSSIPADKKRKIIFITNRKDNLPEEGMKKCYEAHNNPNFDKDILLLRSNKDYIIASFHKKIYWGESKKFKDQYEEMRKIYEEKEEYRISKTSDKSYIVQKKEEDLEELVSKFVTDVNKKVLSLGKTVSDRTRVIEDKKSDFFFVGQIFPCYRLNHYKMIIFTTKKLLTSIRTFVDKKTSLMESFLLHNQIIFFDEFDSSKAVILQDIIEQSIKNRSSNAVSLFVRIALLLQARQFPKTLFTESGDNAWQEKLRVKAEEIFNKYQLSKVLYMEAEENEKYFIFHSYENIYLLPKDKQYVMIHFRENEPQSDIIFLSKDEKENINDDPAYVELYALLKDIYNFFIKFNQSIECAGEKLAEYKNKLRHKSKSIYAEYQTEYGINSLYNFFGIDPKKNIEDINIIRGNVVKPIKFIGKPPKKQDKEDSVEKEEKQCGFYKNSLFYYLFKNDECNHDGVTDFYFTKLKDTPERLLSELAGNNKIIAMSATLEIPSVFSNYSPLYLKKNNKIYYFSEASKKQLQEFHEQNKEKYADGTVKVHTKIWDMLETKSGEQISDTMTMAICNLYGKETEKCRVFLYQFNKNIDRIEQVRKEYFIQRYYNLFRTIKGIVNTPTICSFLFINQALPREAPQLNLALLNHFLSDMIDIMENPIPTEREFCVFDKDSSSDNTLELVYKEWEKGKRRFVFTTYASMGRGINFQHKMNDYIKNIVTRMFSVAESDDRAIKKDVDGLYLGDVTNVFPWDFEEEQENGKEKEKLTSFYYMEALFEDGELNRVECIQDKKDYIDGLLRGDNRRNKIRNMNRRMRSTPSYFNAVLNVLVQAVGRIDRTANKNNDIYLYTTTRNQEHICKASALEMIRSTCIPIMRELIDACKTSNRRMEVDSPFSEKTKREILHSRDYVTELLTCVYEYGTRIEEYINLGNFVVRNFKANMPLLNKNDQQLFIKYAGDSYFYKSVRDFEDIEISDKRMCPNENRLGIRYGKVSLDRVKETLAVCSINFKEELDTLQIPYTYDDMEYILNPVIFTSIYLGRLGEILGKIILGKYGIALQEIKDTEKFERADFVYDDYYYFDFKLWHFSKLNKSYPIKKSWDKLEELGGKKYFVINIFEEVSNVVPYIETNRCDLKVITIPHLILKNGTIDMKQVELIRKETKE